MQTFARHPAGTPDARRTNDYAGGFLEHRAVPAVLGERAPGFAMKPFMPAALPIKKIIERGKKKVKR